MILPIQKSKKIVDLQKQVILIYGRAKIGKSTLCSQFDEPLFLATEPGLNHLEVFKVNCNSWERFLDACRAIAKGGHRFKTIVIDTIDNLIIYCSDYICRENGINHPSELPHGKGWHMVTYELQRALSKLASLPYGLIMVAHSTLEEVETKTKKYTRYSISISGKNRNAVLNMADIILFIDSEVSKDGEEVRVIRTKPSMYYEAGDRSNLLPEILRLDYRELVKYFGGDNGKECNEDNNTDRKQTGGSSADSETSGETVQEVSTNS